MKNGFTLVELLAVIVILAVLALIATPVVLSIIDDTKESAMLRSAEMYLSGVENAVMRENMNSGGNFRPNECIISNGTLSCNSTTVEVEVNGEVPQTGSIVFENGKIKEVELIYESGTIVKDSSGNLVYSNEEKGSGSEGSDEEISNKGLNEYGFYFDKTYWNFGMGFGYIFYEDGTGVYVSEDGTKIPDEEKFSYSNGKIVGSFSLTVYENGKMLSIDSGPSLELIE